MKYVLMFFIPLAIGFSGDGKFGGLVFYDYTYDLREDAENNVGFAINRVYFTYNQELCPAPTNWTSLRVSIVS